MRIKGRVIKGPNRDVIAIPRPEQDIVFEAEAVLDYDDFEKLYPIPVPPTVMKPGGATSLDVENPEYKKERDKYNTARFHWMILKSLEVTDGLEWETVDWKEPETWGNYEKELKASDLTPMEIMKVINMVVGVNHIDDAKMQEARKRFLAGRPEGMLKT